MKRAAIRGASQDEGVPCWRVGPPLVKFTNDVQHPRLFFKIPAMRAHIVIIAPAFPLTAAITIWEGVDKLIAAGETIARPEMTLLTRGLDRRAWRTDELYGCVDGCRAHWSMAAPGTRSTNGPATAYDLGPIGIDTARGRFNVQWKAQWRLSSANGR